MAKAVFHKGQRVFVRPLGTWARIEKVVPQWVKDVDEPLRVFYDLGLGREFNSSELIAEVRDAREDEFLGDMWRVTRRRNRWQMEGVDERHPHPGTHPVVVTDINDWGGWRVPAAEYDRDPDRVEFQARAMSRALDMVRLAREIADFAEAQNISLDGPRLPGVRGEIADMAAKAQAILADVYQVSEKTMALDAAE
jgi:hypothetical protein